MDDDRRMDGISGKGWPVCGGDDLDGVSPALLDMDGAGRGGTGMAVEGTLDEEEAKRLMARVVAKVSQARGVDWKSLFVPKRGPDAVSEARVLAMALCCEMGVRPCAVGRLFGRKWSTVYAARKRWAERREKSEVWRGEWDGVWGKF